MSYAKNTKVPVDKTIGEIRKVIAKAGADGFAFAEHGNCAYIVFRARERGVKMFLRMPQPPTMKSTEASKKAYEQIRRSKWRALLLCVKAKVESVESGIETFEEAFLPHMVLSNGETVGQKMIGQIDQLTQASPQALLGMP